MLQCCCDVHIYRHHGNQNCCTCKQTRQDTVSCQSSSTSSTDACILGFRHSRVPGVLVLGTLGFRHSSLSCCAKRPSVSEHQTWEQAVDVPIKNLFCRLQLRSVADLASLCTLEWTYSLLPLRAFMVMDFSAAFCAFCQLCCARRCALQQTHFSNIKDVDVVTATIVITVLSQLLNPNLTEVHEKTHITLLACQPEVGALSALIAASFRMLPTYMFPTTGSWAQGNTKLLLTHLLKHLPCYWGFNLACQHACRQCVFTAD